MGTTERRNEITENDAEYVGVIRTRTNFGKWKKRRWEIFATGVAKVWSNRSSELKRIINLKNTKIVDTRTVDNNMKVELKKPLYLLASSSKDSLWADLLLKYSAAVMLSLKVKLSHYSDPVMLTNQFGVIVGINSSFQSLFGYKDEIIGVNCKTILGPEITSIHDDYFKTSPLERSETGKPTAIEGIKNDGTKLILMINVGVFCDAKMTLITSFLPVASISAVRRFSSRDEGCLVEDSFENVKIISNFTPIFVNILSGTLTMENITKYSLAEINSVITFDRDGQIIEETSLLALLSQSKWELAEKLIEMGASVNAIRKITNSNKSIQTLTSLDILLEMPTSPEVENFLKYLIDHGADIRKTKLKSKIQFFDLIARPFFSFEYFAKVSVKLAIENRIETLDLSKCSIKSLHSLFPLSSIISLSLTLKKFDLSKNRITILPHSFGLLSNLVELNLSGNAIKTIPDSLGSMKNLNEILLQGNPLVYPPKNVIKQGCKYIIQFLNEKINRTSENLNLKMMIFAEDQKRASKLLSLIAQSCEPPSRTNSLHSSLKYIRDIRRSLSIDQIEVIPDEISSFTLEGKMKSEIFRKYYSKKRKEKEEKDILNFEVISNKFSPSFSPIESKPVGFLSFVNDDHILLLEEEKTKKNIESIKSKLLDTEEGLLNHVHNLHRSKNGSNNSGSFSGEDLLNWLSTFIEPSKRGNIAQELINQNIIQKKDLNNNSNNTYNIYNNLNNHNNNHLNNNSLIESFNERNNYSFTFQIDVKVTINCRSFSLDESISKFNYLFTERTIYLIEFDLSTYYIDNKLEFWLQSIYSRSQSNSAIIIVGTYKNDISPAEAQKILGEINNKFSKTFATVKCITSLNLKTKYTNHITDKIRSESFHILENTPPISNSFTILYNIISEMKNNDPPVVSLSDLRWIAKQLGIDQDQLNVFLRYFNDSGLLITFPETNSITKGLSEFVIVDPKWVSNLINFLLENHLDFNFGIAERKVIQKLWDSKEFSPKFQEFIFPFFQSVEIILPIHNTNYFIIPFLLPDEDHFLNFQNYIEDDIFWVVKKTGLFKERKTSLHLTRLFKMEFIPPGAMSRLTKRILEIYSVPKEVNLFLSRHCIIISQPEKFQVIFNENEEQRQFSIRLRCFDFDEKNFLFAVNLFRTAIDYWITLINYYYHIKYSEWIPCSNCLKLNPNIEVISINPTLPNNNLISFYRIDQCLIKPKLLKCDHCSSSFSISDLDYDLADRHIKTININGQIKNIKEEKTIGEGSFAQIKQIKLQIDNENNNGKEEIFAVKLFTQTETKKQLADIRREISITNRLNPHPNIVSMIGISIDPIAIIMDISPIGDLYSYLHNKEIGEISWKLRVKIALDIAMGLEHMHSSSPSLIHRDLKSPNILLFEDKRCGTMTAKITDFGCSLILSGDGIREQKDERDVQVPTWLAPEVILGDLYSEKADIYAFGIILNELITRKHPYKGMVKKDFNHLIEKLILRGIRPESLPQFEYASDYAVRYHSLKEECWAHYPHDRPDISNIIKTLREIDSLIVI